MAAVSCSQNTNLIWTYYRDLPEMTKTSYTATTRGGRHLSFNNQPITFASSSVFSTHCMFFALFTTACASLLGGAEARCQAGPQQAHQEYRLSLALCNQEQMQFAARHSALTVTQKPAHMEANLEVTYLLHLHRPVPCFTSSKLTGQSVQMTCRRTSSHLFEVCFFIKYSYLNLQ